MQIRMLPMIAFATFILGLVTGDCVVGVVPGENVARVEMLLDGQLVAEIRKPPWEAVVDFGPYPEPHLLVAVAMDQEGGETARVEQWVNRPKRLAEASLVLTPGTGGRGRSAVLSWRSVVAADPVATRITFDGTPLPVADAARIALPDFEPAQVHFLKAELDFPQNVSAVAEIIFGGRQPDEAQTDLTAILVTVPKSGKPKSWKLPRPEAMEGWFTDDCVPLRVVAVEDGPGEVLVVVDSSARHALEAMAFSGSWFRDSVHLPKDQRLRVVSPFPERRHHSGVEHFLFPISEDLFPSASGGFLQQYARLRQPGWNLEDQRLVDALAVAGMSASGRDRRRAVVLLTGPEPFDRSRLSVEGVRHYFASIGVPFFTIVVHPYGHEAAAAFGGPVLDGSSARALRDAFRELADTLERQRVVWLAGKLLPQRIALTPEARDIARVP